MRAVMDMYSDFDSNWASARFKTKRLYCKICVNGVFIIKILLIGGGGREHALAWRIANNPSGELHKLYAAPGNAGIEDLAENVPIKATDIEGLCRFAKENGIEYTVVGMDDPLELGVCDRFRSEGLKIFGPSKEAAKLEWSKSYAKSFMRRHGIPTAEYDSFTDFNKAKDYASKARCPLVVKADGLAGGKGVYVCDTNYEAIDALNEIMLDKRFGNSGNTVLIEEFLSGFETTVMTFCDGKTIVPMESAKDHKKAFDNDKGANTGGMGVVSPSPHYTPSVARLCEELIFKPTLEGLKKDGVDYRGVLYFGLMLTKNGPYVIEYNARFGDPETQTLMPRLQTDLLSIMKACDNAELDKIDIRWDNESSACVVLASGGYPGAFLSGHAITGLDIQRPGALVFHAGTKREQDRLLTAGGRVLGVVCRADTIEEAADACYRAAKCIHFQDMRYRKDIGRLKCPNCRN